MNDLQLSLLAIGAVIIAGVYAYNRIQERHFRRNAEEKLKSSHADVLMGGFPTARPLPVERVEPVIGQPVVAEAPEVPDVPEAPVAEPIPQPEPEAVEPVPTPAIREPDPVEPPVVAEPEPLSAQAEQAESEPLAESVEQVMAQAVPFQPVPASALDSQIHYVAELHAGDPIPGQSLMDAMLAAKGLVKPVAWLGYNGKSGNWESIVAGNEYLRIQAGLLLADRTGPLAANGMNAFCDLVQDLATRITAVVDLPDRSTALARAAELDAFCAQVDILIGLNVVSVNGEPFLGTKVRTLAEATGGMKLRPDGTFQAANDEGIALFSLSNMESTPFSADIMKSLTTHGVTLLFDVPRVPRGVRVFEQMLSLARQMTSTLGGQLVDDNRRPLSEQGLERIRQQLKDIYAKMDARQLPAGSPAALKLFS
jgi:FtsZ-interacting cell division protein ZipA